MSLSLLNNRIWKFDKTQKKMNKQKLDQLFLRNPAEITKILENSCIGIAGCGGLGSNAAIALVRAGIGKLLIADFDVVELSNLNRQSFFLEDVGKKKAIALEHHLKRINPNIVIKVFQEKITKLNAIQIFGDANLLIEAFDKAEYKQMLIDCWSTKFPEKPIICGNGIAGYGKTDLLKVTKTGNIYFCGDGISTINLGLCSARVSIVANMQANVAIQVLMKSREK